MIYHTEELYMYFVQVFLENTSKHPVARWLPISPLTLGLRPP